MTYVRYEFWLETQKDEGSDLQQVTETLRSGSEIVAKRRLEERLYDSQPFVDFQGVVEEGRYVKDPGDPQETIFEQSGRTWLLRPAGDTIEWVEDFAPEDVAAWAKSS